MGKRPPRKRPYRLSDATRLLRKAHNELRATDARVAHIQGILSAICDTLDIDVPATREQAVAALRDLIEGHRDTVATLQREAELNPAAVTSWPVRGDWLLNTPDGPKPLVEGYREAWKVWKTKASEARGLAGLMTYIAWCADPVAMAAKLGHDESDRYKATLLVLDAVRAGKRVEIVGTAPCYVHLSGVPGVPQFVARMQPEIIMRSEDAIDEVPLGERATHWLSSPSRDGKTVWETSPYLLVGAGAWDTDAASFPEPAMARYGRVGAPGSPWWVMVKRSDK